MQKGKTTNYSSP